MAVLRMLEQQDKDWIDARYVRKDSVAIFAVMDDLMDTIRVTAPRAYDSVMRRVREL